jgi:D-alanyl-D-alanine carboxypeptidase
MGACALLAAYGDRAGATETLPPELASRIDAVVSNGIARASIPSASIALVQHRAIVYAHAYGWAQLEPRRTATPQMPYPLASISKEFTAAAVLLLQERGQLSLGDPAGKYLPNLGSASGVTLRALLSHTGGVRDFWPQDYAPPEMLQPIDPRQIVARWAGQPLDFPPGSDWQYSNTGYTISGLIVERLTHESLFRFLQSGIFKPLGMASPLDYGAGPLPRDAPVGYTHYALGPPRPAQREGLGWTLGAGQLAMTASDLARWDISLMEQHLLRPESYRDLTHEVQLTSGVGTSYALGLEVSLDLGRRVLKHGGALMGFTSHNRIYPDDGTAVVVLTNGENGSLLVAIADELSKILLAQTSPLEAAAESDSKRVFADLQHGRIDTGHLTDNARSYFTPAVLADYASSLAPLGEPQGFTLVRRIHRGGFLIRAYEVSFAQKKLTIVVLSAPDGRLEQYAIYAK